MSLQKSAPPSLHPQSAPPHLDDQKTESFPAYSEEKAAEHHAAQHHDQRPLHDSHKRPEFHTARSTEKVRTFSLLLSNLRKHEDGAKWAPPRRFSADLERSRELEFEVHVEETLKQILDREDTDKNIQITIEDKGPKWINLGTLHSDGYVKHDIRTTYHMSNLLQELTIAKEKGLKCIILSESRINENPVDRLARLIKDEFWSNLTRQIDGGNVAKVGLDTKDWNEHPRPRIYVPRGAPEQHEYYTRIAHEHPEVNLDVVWLSEDPSNEEYVRDLNDAPGLLALEMERVKDTKKGEPDFKGLKFVVPGGRFNELYGWDSYMESLGLIIHDKVTLAKNMVKHFCFCIRHYGKILNANRTYYLCRTQPPFLTDMALRVYSRIKHQPDAKEFLRVATLAAIKEYYNVWMSAPRYDAESGLSRYRAQGLGVPPETEASHFEHVLSPYAKKHNMSYKEFIRAYNFGKVHEPELDNFFLHDRAVRESGHDTSYRLENVAADLAVVDLNSCLYKYETDIAHIIETEFDGHLTIPSGFCAKRYAPGYVEIPSTWTQRAAQRKETMTKLMWDEKTGMFFDYDTHLKKQTGYESVTTFWSLWAGVATQEQAHALVKRALPLFEVGGGLVSGTEKSRGSISLSRPNRQWDYPFGWAPQQILAWHGMLKYGYEQDAKRLAYRWCHMVTRAFVDFNGVVVEKYNVTDPKRPHIVAAEYGNQGSDFKGRPTEGFGWVNASYIVGLNILDRSMRRGLGALATWEEYRNAKAPKHRASSTYATKIVEDLKPHLVPTIPEVVSPAAIGSPSGHEQEHRTDQPHGAASHVPATSGAAHPRQAALAAMRFDGAVDWRHQNVFTEVGE
ncbi:trehalase-domain-containing protein [Elsinoe ampelina]|uniref:Trehalase n=1 Tax=Elsinoe ampelina TaxID=302913 RepID=A0A6A6GEA9_9PEZI|nr:trehalase-domain-containing protein [Elsinoe ampelina]